MKLKVAFLVLAVWPVRSRDRQDQAEELLKAPLRSAELLRALPTTGEELLGSAQERRAAESSAHNRQGAAEGSAQERRAA